MQREKKKKKHKKNRKLWNLKYDEHGSRERRIRRAYFSAVGCWSVRQWLATFSFRYIYCWNFWQRPNTTKTHSHQIRCANNIHLGCWQLHQRLRRQTKRIMCIYCSTRCIVGAVVHMWLRRKLHTQMATKWCIMHVVPSPRSLDASCGRRARPDAIFHAVIKFSEWTLLFHMSMSMDGTLRAMRLLSSHSTREGKKNNIVYVMLTHYQLKHRNWCVSECWMEKSSSVKWIRECIPWWASHLRVDWLLRHRFTWTKNCEIPTGVAVGCNEWWPPVEKTIWYRFSANSSHYWLMT